MRMASVAHRLTLLPAGGDAIDVARLSDHRFSSDPQAVYERWGEFRDWAADVGAATDGAAEAVVAPESLGSPAPSPRQVFAIGLNYTDHAQEAGLGLPEAPPTFTKFPTCITGPYGELPLPSGAVDWEVELVVVIGRRAHRVKEEKAWEYVAGLTVGQDFSEREVQLAGPAPQFSLGKSFPAFGPIGPWLVTPDEFDDPDDLELSCTVNGERVQKARTSSMIFPVPELIARLSAVCPLLPGDLIFTGTPSGVGGARNPRKFLAPGDVVVSRVEGIGEIRQHCTG
ncbi:fumarylacetoacetate hydrolase family protein [Streptomyces sp. NPDC096132]|uniref:fumarylacetoacetate hydrolase family protein n=1 Tax=Streptomyces sp. NPDC096132 TaxID=3366075 RepID=UPI0038010FFA